MPEQSAAHEQAVNVLSATLERQSAIVKRVRL